MLIIADEIIRMTRFMMEGVTVDEMTLALDAINRIRPGGGFLADDHTLNNWRWAQWTPDLINRQRYDTWIEAGSKELFTSANERARKILDEHEVPPLSDEAEAMIAEILAERNKS
jgi:trimethylamine--corrinoid protein Co-methyltransferase